MDNRTAFLSTIQYKTYIHLLIIILVGFAAYSNTFEVPFVFDDETNITNNAFIQDLGKVFEPSVASDSRYHESFRNKSILTRSVGYLSFSLSYKLFGHEVEGYHLVNICIHLINGVLVYFLLTLTFKTPLFSVSSGGDNAAAGVFTGLFAALIFVAHPIQTQAVTYIVQRLASLAAMFYLLSLVLYIKFRLTESVKAKYLLYALTFMSTVAAMLSKEISFTLPVIIALYEFTFFEGTKKKQVLFLIPLFFTMLIIPAIMLTAIGSADAVRLADPDKISRLDYLFTQFSVLVTYLRLMIAPVNQNLDYDFPIYRSFLDPNVFLSFIFLSSLIGIGIFLFYRSRQKNSSAPCLRLIAFGIFWFFITLAVESSIIPIDDIIFEHRMYLPSVGLIASFMASLLLLKKKLNFALPKTSRIIIPALIFIVILLSGATYARNNVWHDNISIWQDAVRKSPNKARPHYNLGEAYLEHDLAENSIKESKIALQISPDLLEPHNNLGVAYIQLEKFDDAHNEFLYLLERNPYNVRAHNNMGIVYQEQGKHEDAIRSFRNALKLSPDSIKAHINLGRTFEELGQLDDAVKEYQVVLKSDPAFIISLLNLGTCRMQSGKFQEAIRRYKIVIMLKPDLIQAHYNLAMAHKKLNHLTEAAQGLQNTIRLDPGLALAHYDLALVYKQQNKLADAAKELETVLKFQPDYPSARTELEIINNAAKSKK
jgi:tetratricopeptide (TPR) repeat protein